MDDTSAKLFEVLDLTWSGPEEVAAQVEAGNWDAVRAPLQPACASVSTVDASNVTAAVNALRQRFTVIDLPHTFTEEIDWTYNPTMEPSSSYAFNHVWTWQFNRHRF